MAEHLGLALAGIGNCIVGHPSRSHRSHRIERRRSGHMFAFARYSFADSLLKSFIDHHHSKRRRTNRNKLGAPNSANCPLAGHLLRAQRPRTKTRRQRESVSGSFLLPRRSRTEIWKQVPAALAKRREVISCQTSWGSCFCPTLLCPNSQQSQFIRQPCVGNLHL